MTVSNPYAGNKGNFDPNRSYAELRMGAKPKMRLRSCKGLGF